MITDPVQAGSPRHLMRRWTALTTGNPKRVRRWAALFTAVLGIANVINGTVPPFRHRLQVLEKVLPLFVMQAGGVLVTLSGLALLALARGVRRGQQRAYVALVIVLAATLAFHLARGVHLLFVPLTALFLAFLLAYRKVFAAPADATFGKSAAAWILAGCGAVAMASVASVMFLPMADSDGTRSGMPFGAAIIAVGTRLVGIDAGSLPYRFNPFLPPILLTTGIVAVVVILWYATRPLLATKLHHSSAGGLDQWARASDLVRRYGGETIDYFALRDDKSFHFHGDSVVAFTVLNGVCLVSPDPIGPRREREEVWKSFAAMVAANGWIIGIIGASEEWLPIYQSFGMKHMYIGDEGVVDLARFGLAGNSMKGLRQAYNRMKNRGYVASFYDVTAGNAAALEDLRAGLAPLMESSRRGEQERGFSMMLGRVADPRDAGSLLCTVHDPSGALVAFCQFVPAPSVRGMSLDIMRWDKDGDHPNGLVDFALCSTIFHLRDRGMERLSLNFASMRAIFERERGSGLTLSFQYWAYKQLSRFVQMESLLRFNAKYRPEWLPRYFVFDSPEHVLTLAYASFKVESLAELPVLGRLLN